MVICSGIAPSIIYTFQFLQLIKQNHQSKPCVNRYKKLKFSVLGKHRKAHRMIMKTLIITASLSTSWSNGSHLLRYSFMTPMFLTANLSVWQCMVSKKSEERFSPHFSDLFARRDLVHYDLNYILWINFFNCFHQCFQNESTTCWSHQRF